MNKKEIVEYALNRTRILRMPRSSLSTFGTTNIEYYMLSDINDMTRVREGRVISHRPKILKPYEITELFEGFGNSAEEFGREVFDVFGKNPRILNYRFTNKPRKSSESSSSIKEVYLKIGEQLDKKNSRLTAVIEGGEDTWQISVMKFIIDMTLKSAGENIMEMEEKGMFPDEKGIPGFVRNRIEFLFREAEKDRSNTDELGKYLTKQGVFREYEDRFFRLFRNKRK